MKHSKEICHFLGVEEKELKNSFDTKTLNQMDVAWLRDRFDILHNLAFPLFKSKEHRDPCPKPFRYHGVVSGRISSHQNSDLHRVDLTSVERNMLFKMVLSRRSSARRAIYKSLSEIGVRRAKTDLSILQSLVEKLDET